MVITTRDDLADRISKQRAFGIDKSVLADRRHTGAYEIEHVGLNYRMGETGAAMGAVQMERLPGFLEHRERIFGLLERGPRRTSRRWTWCARTTTATAGPATTAWSRAWPTTAPTASS